MDRVIIGKNHKQRPLWQNALGTILIYLPILIAVPFAIIAVVLTKWHLKIMGAENLKSYSDFVPKWVSHRYTRDDQITFETGMPRWQPSRYRIFWIFNCKLYCPMSVALFGYLAYLVKVVENWWCPFYHDKKETYEEGAIDASFWHIYPDERQKLHPEDRENPIWNEKGGVSQYHQLTFGRGVGRACHNSHKTAYTHTPHTDSSHSQSDTSQNQSVSNHPSSRLP